MKLTVCILSLPDRLNFLSSLLQELYSQPLQYLKKTEILIAVDTKQYTIGEKRNQLLDAAKGKYITFIDDDDSISPNYLESIFKGIELGVDGIGITGMYAPVVGTHKKFKCSKDYIWEEKPDAYYRSIQHICPIKTEIAKKVRYPHINFTEDKLYADSVQPFINTDYKIEEVIYHYKYRHKK
jgi:glycosyltransferase involved in cell wall biosynthesis